MYRGELKITMIPAKDLSVNIYQDRIVFGIGEYGYKVIIVFTHSVTATSYDVTCYDVKNVDDFIEYIHEKLSLILSDPKDKVLIIRENQAYVKTSQGDIITIVDPSDSKFF